MLDQPLILFLCPHGAAKSVIAAAYCRREAIRRGVALRADAAGTHPDPAIASSVVVALEEEGIDVSGYVPRRVTSHDLVRASRVVSLGCDPADLPVDGIPVERWDDVPSVMEDIDLARRSIAGRITRMFDDYGEAP